MERKKCQQDSQSNPEEKLGILKVYIEIETAINFIIIFKSQFSMRNTEQRQVCTRSEVSSGPSIRVDKFSN